ncbi:MAG: ATP-binding protein [Betaproteobacteria bacterium]
MKPADLILDQGAAPKRVYRGRLFRKYFLLILALVCGVLLVSGGISVYFSYQENKSALASLQHEKAVAAASRIEQFIRQIEQQLGFAALPQLGADGVEQRRIEFLKLLRQVPAVTDITQLDARGQEVLSVSRLAMDVAGSSKDRSRDPAFLGAKPGQTWFGPVYFRKETEPYMAIALRSGGATGPVTVAEVNLKFIWDVVTRIKIGQKGKAYVVDGTGHLVADPDIGLVLRKTDYSKLAHVQAALAGTAEEGERARLTNDLAGKEVLTAFAGVEPLGWKVFVEQPVSEVYATLNATIVRTAMLMVAGLLFSALTALWLARGLVRPIRTLQEGAQRIGEGELDQKIDIRTGDELEALADQFNRMTAQLRESYAGLERKVEERTAELTETLSQQTATAEILHVISRSPTNTKPVFDAIAVNSARLIGDGSRASLWIAHDGKYEPVAFSNPDDASEAVAGMFPREIDSDTLIGNMLLNHQSVQVSDILETNFETAKKVAKIRGWRACIGVPLMREDVAVGAIWVARTRVGGFTSKQLNILETFASQAVIAIENVRLFNEIQDKSRQLEIAGKHKSEFLANMSHELRTPLNAIIGFSEVLIERMFGELNEKQADYLNDIHTSGKHLLSLINDILDLSKIEAGRMDLELSTFDVPDALANALTLIRERATRHNIALVLDAAAGLGEITADERKFKQILLNLLSNAVKFTPDSGRVEVRSRRNEGALEVAVIDTGIGIAPDDQAAVFEEFRQVGRHYTNKNEGTGLGLALTKRFVELHGGRLWLESEPGKGSTFTFTIPSAP